MSSSTRGTRHSSASQQRIIIRLDIILLPENNSTMTTLHVEGNDLALRFTTFEKIAGLVRDTRVPLSSIRSVEVVEDGLAAAKGLRAPGLGLPGIRKLGTWRTLGAKSLVSVRRDVPAVRITLDGERYDTLLVSTPDAAAIADRLAATTGGASHA
jgi:hypothetical protein